MVELLNTVFHAREDDDDDDGEHEDEKGSEHVDDVPDVAEVVACALVEESLHVHEDEEGKRRHKHRNSQDYRYLLVRNRPLCHHHQLQVVSRMCLREIIVVR